MRSFLPAVLLLAATSLPALASGGISCEAQDDNVTISISSGVTRGMGAPLFNLTGTLKTNLEGIDQDMREISYDVDDVAQWWLDGEQLNLLLYVERDGEVFGSTDLTIMTRAVDEGSYEGEYTVVSYDDGVRGEVTGKIACFAE